MAFTENDTELVVQQDGPVVQVTLNRPEALNALSLEMIRMLSSSLRQWEEDDAVKAVLIQGAGDRAFCAGGDVKNTYKSGMAYRRGNIGLETVSLYFGEEYRLNRQLFHFKKPLIALMNGIAMGGGFGVAGPCRYRIASEKTVFAMPEVGIGFFPDVGSTYFLNRCPGEAGAYLALSGNSIGPADTYYSGLATHYVPVDQQPDLLEKLAKAAETGENALEKLLDEFHATPDGPGFVEEHQALIDSCFAADEVEDVIDNLREGTEFLELAETIESRSPISLKVSLAHLRRAKNMDFDQVTAQDFTLCKHFLTGHDFYEGVRAVLIDKDKKPQWDPKTLAAINAETVMDYFGRMGRTLDEIAA